MSKRPKLITTKQYLESVRIVNEYLNQQVKVKDKDIPPIYVCDIDVSVRLYNLFKTHGITTLNQISDMEVIDFMSWKNFGRKTLEELEGITDYHGIPRTW
jgi:DNA-directed RNA polymerase alpha subunit